MPAITRSILLAYQSYVAHIGKPSSVRNNCLPFSTPFLSLGEASVPADNAGIPGKLGRQPRLRLPPPIKFSPTGANFDGRVPRLHQPRVRRLNHLPCQQRTRSAGHRQRAYGGGTVVTPLASSFGTTCVQTIAVYGNSASIGSSIAAHTQRITI